GSGRRARAWARVRIRATPPPAAVTSPAGPVRKLAPPPEKKAVPTPAPSLRDAPKVDAAQQAPQMNLPQIAEAPPQLQTQEKPKLAFETPAAATVGQGTGKLARPGSGVQEALNSVIRGGSGGMVVGGAAAASTGI